MQFSLKKKQKGILSESEKEELQKISSRREKVSKDIQQYITDKKPSNIGESQMLALYKKRLDDVNKKVREGKTCDLVISDSTKINNEKQFLFSHPEQDIFVGLDEKYSAEQIEIIKKIINIIDVNFYSDAYKKITKGIKATILKELKK